MLKDHLDIDPAEMIDVRFWEALSKELGGPERFVHFSPNEHTKDLFSRSFSTPQTVISAFSDYGICEQEENHPNQDIRKRFHMVDWQALMSMRGRYAGANIGPCCDPASCNAKDKFSIKIDAHTIATLSCLPYWLKHWYTTNCAIKDSRVTCIPFGLNDDGPGLGMLPSFRGREKTGFLYINFQDNTIDRVDLKRYFKDKPWVTFRDNASLPVDQYLDEVASHKFVLSPLGNGLDCYRTYEAMYLGSVPLIQHCTFGDNLAKLCLPFTQLHDMIISELDIPDMNDTWNFVNQHDWNYGPLTKSYWRERIAREIA